ncbi:MAG TPA: hypothetical protein VHF51_17865 [Solirubrobacteraceae bacterium]|nr:hypothetical protein [Solirubrobacteraceae bacterium]
MDHPPTFDPSLDPDDGDVEEVDAVPVLSEAGALEPRRSAGQVVARQAAAVAATSFAAGVATVAIARAHRVRRARRRTQRALGPVVASRSFLVDVHLLGPRE